MNPPLGNGFRLHQRHQKDATASFTNKSKRTLTHMQTSTKKLKPNVSSKATAAIKKTYNRNTYAASSTILSTPSASVAATSNCFFTNLNLIVTLIAIVILNNVGCFITPTAASAQRDNTRLLILKSGKPKYFMLIT